MTGVRIENQKDNIPLLRPISEEDSDIIFQWRNDPWIRSLGSGNDRAVSREEHSLWFQRIRDNTHHLLFIVQTREGRPIGTVRFDRDNEQAIISIYLMKDHTGRGIGPRAIEDGCLRAFACWSSLQRVVARIRNNNEPSIKAFDRAGFIPFMETQDLDNFVTMVRKAPSNLTITRRE